MKENKYGDEKFFDRYCKMSRSIYGLRGAGEWIEPEPDRTLFDVIPGMKNELHRPYDATYVGSEIDYFTLLFNGLFAFEGFDLPIRLPVGFAFPELLGR